MRYILFILLSVFSMTAFSAPTSNLGAHEASALLDFLGLKCEIVLAGGKSQKRSPKKDETPAYSDEDVDPEGVIVPFMDPDPSDSYIGPDDTGSGGGPWFMGKKDSGKSQQERRPHDRYEQDTVREDVDSIPSYQDPDSSRNYYDGPDNTEVGYGPFTLSGWQDPTHPMYNPKRDRTGDTGRVQIPLYIEDYPYERRPPRPPQPGPKSERGVWEIDYNSDN